MKRPAPLPQAPRAPQPEPSEVGEPATITALLEAPEPADAASGALDARDVWRAARERRRALRTEVRRFTGRARRRRVLWIGTTAAVAVVVAGTLGAAYSPLFAVQRIDVVGTRALDAGAVAEALSAQLGTPLPLVDASEVKAALVRFPLVESYSLQARPPHDLVVRIVERTPIGVVSSQAGYTVVDGAGVALSTTPTRPAGMPQLTVPAGTRSDAFQAVGLVLRSLPAAIRSQVTAAGADSPDSVTLTLGGTGTTVVWGSADDSAMKALVLEATMKTRPPATVSQYDVSAPHAIVVR